MKQLVQLHAGYRSGVLCTSLIQQWNGRNVSKAKPTTLGWSSSTVLDRNTQALHSGKLTIVNMEHTSQKLLVKCQCKLVQAKDTTNFQNERKWLWFFSSERTCLSQSVIEISQLTDLSSLHISPMILFHRNFWCCSLLFSCSLPTIYGKQLFSVYCKFQQWLTIQKQREPKQTTIFIYLGRTDNHEGAF